MLPAAVVAPIAARVRALASWGAIGSMTLVGLVGLACSLGDHVASAGDLGHALALLLVTGLWHEIGHATALSREGWSPGPIGVGLLWVLPVYWADVSATTLLGRSGRIRVDLAGVAFQAGAVGLIGLSAAVFDWPAGAIAARAGGVAMAWSLLPLVRSDGHWLVCDLFGLDGLTSSPPATLGSRGSFLLLIWRLATLLAVVAIVIVVLARLAHSASASPAWLIVTLGTIGLLGTVRAATRTVAIVRAIVRDRRPRG